MRLKRASIFTMIVILAVIVYAVIMLANVGSRIRAAEADRNALQEKVAVVQRENAALAYDVAHAEDPEILAGIARSRLGLVEPGEKVFYDVGN